jgi:predicted ATPase
VRLADHPDPRLREALIPLFLRQPELADQTPELVGLLPAAPLDAPGGQSRFFEGLRQLLGAICQDIVPNVLFFDDMHWADAASLDLLAYLVRRLAGQPLFILATWRSDEGQSA